MQSNLKMCVLACCLGLTLAPHLGRGASFYPVRLQDPQAVYLDPSRFPVMGDGLADDSDALQAAIDAVAEGNGAGVLFVPEGVYRLGKTLVVWPGVRLIGYGMNRPTFLLAKNTPGFQEGEGKYVIFFSGGRARGGGPPRDGGAGTFYSALSNVDLEIQAGNPAAVGIRFHVAQHCYLSHMELRLGTAKAGLEDIGNEVEDLHFKGGRYGILTGRSAPGWPILVIDCTFEGQTEAAISCDEAGLAVVRPRFSNVPTAVSMVAGKPDQLWVSDAVLENVSGPAFVISHERSARTQVNLENVICRKVPVFARLRQSGETVYEAGPRYVVERLSRGLHLDQVGFERRMATTASARALADDAPMTVQSDIPPLPPSDSWVSVRTIGAVGDGETDDTAALQTAIARHRTLYLPLGVYRVSDTLKLRSDTILVGLNPSATALYVADGTSAFQDARSPRAVIEAPSGGSNILSGFGVYAAPMNPAAVEVKWMAGARSMINDVRFHGGHGTRLPGGIGDSWGRLHRERWASQFPSLWVTDGGGGVFKNIWTPSPYAKAGWLISNTTTPGRLYAMSAEHHVSNEVILRNVSNWRFYALQFEEEREEGPKALPLEIENCRDLLFANTFFYRVVSSFVPHSCATRLSRSRGVRFRNVHVYSNSKVSFDSAVCDPTTGREVRDSEFAVLDVSDQPWGQRPQPLPSWLARGQGIEKVADGFLNICGAAVDDRGDVYFADPREFQVYRWSVERQSVEPVRRIPERPEQLAFDQAGNLLVLGYEGKGTVLAFDPREPDSEMQVLEAQPARARPDAQPVLPVNRWLNIEAFQQDSLMQKPFHYVAPDGRTFIPAGEDYAAGATMWGVKLSDVLRAFRIAPARRGERFYVCNEAELRTWSFQVGTDGTLTDPQLFVEEGGEGVVVDSQGRVYIACGQIRVFSPEGQLLEVIDVPQRPTGLVFGGEERKTLFITARSSLYRLQLR